jgi:hypothetical protein
MMLHQDGSRAEWLEGQPALDLIVTMDDATSTIYSAFLVEEEGTAARTLRRRWSTRSAGAIAGRRVNRFDATPPGLWICGQRQRVAHNLHKASRNDRSGQLMCYENRTT